MASNGSNQIPGFAHAIQVDRRLVRLLSDAMYTSFSNCLRELAINAYDADATALHIEYDVPPRLPGDAGPHPSTKGGWSSGTMAGACPGMTSRASLASHLPEIATT